MYRTKRMLSMLTAASIFLVLPLAASAADRGAVESDRNVDAAELDVVTGGDVDAAPIRPSDSASDRPGDNLTDRPSDRVTDHPTDRCDIRRYAVTHRDCLTDHSRDRCDLRRFAATHPDCIDDHSDLNIRKLIHRLIHAGEWAKLIRLLHWLGWI